MTAVNPFIIPKNNGSMESSFTSPIPSPFREKNLNMMHTHNKMTHPNKSATIRAAASAGWYNNSQIQIIPRKAIPCKIHSLGIVFVFQSMKATGQSNAATATSFQQSNTCAASVLTIKYSERSRRANGMH